MSFLDKNAPHFLQFLCLIDTCPIRRAKIEFFLVLQIENYFGFDCIYAHEMQFLQKPRRYMDFSGMFWRSSQFPRSGPIVLIMQVPWRFHGGSMEFWCRLHRFSRYVLKVFPDPPVWSCCINNAGSMEVPWRFHGVLM